MSGFVTVAGAGCAPGLITRRAAEALSNADAVVYDALVPPETLALAAPGAELIPAGKRAGEPSARQEEIISRLIALARGGRRVVRLHGGDPFVFGRGGEELSALNAAGIACELIPGVSSALAVPALHGIPLTQRGLVRGFTVVTASTAALGGELPGYFDEIRELRGTLVVLMGLSKLAAIAGRLISNGLRASTPCAVCSDTRCVRGTLADIAELAADFPPPAVIVIGEAAALDMRPAHSLPLAGRSVGLTGTRRMNAKLSRCLRRLGAETFTACELVIEPRPDIEPPTGGCVAFTSPVGAEIYFGALAARGLDARALAGTRFAAVGRATAAALAEHGIRADLVPEGQSTAALAGLLVSELEPGSEITLFRSALGSRELYERLKTRFSVCDLAAYSASPGGERAPCALIDRADALAFTSAAGARFAIEALSPIPERALLAAIGEPTAKALKELCNPVVIAESPGAQALSEAIVRVLT